MNGARRDARIGIAAVGLATVVSLVAPPFARDQLLQHVPTALGLVVLERLAARDLLSRRAVWGLVAFAFLHVIGARWVYTNVPYDAWLDGLFGTDTRALFGWTRNHYDRAVHLAFGLLFVRPTAELCARAGAVRLPHVALGQCVVWAVSAIYEVFEWGLTLVVHGELALRYNGQQGDAWDAQKDMALAGLGALVAGAWMLARRARERGARC